MSKNLSDTLAAIAKYQGNEPDLLEEFIAHFRKISKFHQGEIDRSFQELIHLLKAHEGYKNGLIRYISQLCSDKKFLFAWIDTGQIGKNSFRDEISRRFTFKFLPWQYEKNTIEYIISNSFSSKKDIPWIEKISDSNYHELLDIFGVSDSDQWAIDHPFLDEMLFAVRILAHRGTGIAFENEILRMAPEYLNFESPFVGLMDVVDEYLDELRAGKIFRNPDEELYKHLKLLLHQCYQFIEDAYKNRTSYGISIKTNQELLNLTELLDRIQILSTWISNDRQQQQFSIQIIDILTHLISFQQGKTEIGSFIGKSTQVIAQEITQHTASKGEHYITSTAAEYKQMLKTALGGGLIVGILCLIKLWFSTFDTSLFGSAFLYSMNYAIGFTAIYLTGMTLATKQPAMTAATITKALSDGIHQPDKYEAIAALLVKLSRSQFIAFVGNVLMAFPVAMLLIFGTYELTGYNMATKKAHHLLEDLHPLHSLAIFHAGIAGIFLFLSGLIAGQVSNANIYNKTERRIREHPLLKSILSENKRNQFAALYAKYSGGIISNFWFGVFMGCTGVIGTITGLPIDIRHITFAAGNLALGIFGENFLTSWSIIAWSLLGIFLIGCMNFLVSFTLSLSLAFRSRGIPMTEVSEILKVLGRKFKKNPLPFFIPIEKRHD